MCKKSPDITGIGARLQWTKGASRCEEMDTAQPMGTQTCCTKSPAEPSLQRQVYTMCLLPLAAGTNGHKLSGLKQYKYLTVL